MPQMFCEQFVGCPGTDLPIANFSAENPDQILFLSTVFDNTPPRLNNTYTSLGCVSECDSAISQADADQCAARQAYLCTKGGGGTNPDNPVINYTNTPQSCTVKCPDGLPFTYTVPGGLYVGDSQTKVNSQAYQFACQQAAFFRICLGNLPHCTCVNANYTGTIQVSSLESYVWILVAGSYPPGLTFFNGTLSGIPTTPGQYSFTLEALTQFNTFMRKVYTITVLQITTTSIPGYTVNTPYSFQMAVTGGSGNYAWKITSGTLPDGLTMSLEGLITGTPTGLSGGGSLTFDVVDTTCEQVDASFFPPIVALTTKSVTTIATLLGYSEWVPSSPPKKYKTITWSGSSEQVSFLVGGVSFAIDYTAMVSDIKYVWSGAGQIDGSGNQISNYRRDQYQACPASTFSPNFDTNITPVAQVQTLRGYCWPADPNSCPTCDYPAFSPTSLSGFSPDWNSFTPGFVRNVARDSINDLPLDLVGGANTTTTPTTLTNIQQINFPLVIVQSGGINGTTNLPPTIFGINGLNGPWIGLFVNHNFSAVLTDEYTDAEALSHAQVITSNGATAQNLPRTTGFVNRTTSVNYTLKLSNLIIGRNYLVTVNFRNQNFVKSSVQFGITANATSQSITSAIPQPPAGGQLTVISATAAFLP